MFNIIPGNHSYKISLDNKIITYDNWECEPIINNNFILITLYNKQYSVHLDWLKLFAHFEINLPKEFQNRIFEINFSDYKYTTCEKIFKFNKPFLLRSKYRIIPCFTNYAISENGEILDIEKNELITIHFYGDYPSVWIYDADKKRKRLIYVHRLIALAWINNENFIEKPIINHKDGNKLNYNKKNLEWVSYKRNNNHAFENNLRKDNMPCKVFDTIENKIIIYSSIGRACESINCNIKSAVILSRKKLIKNRYEIKLLDDKTDWKFKPNESNKTGRYFIELISDKNVKEIYKDLYYFKTKFKIWNTSNVKQLIEKFKQKFPLYNINIIDNYNVQEIEYYNINTKQIYKSESIRQLSRDLNIQYSILHNYLKNNKTKILNGYLFRYKNDKTWEINNYVVEDLKPKRILALNQITNECLEFTSIRQLAKFFSADRSVFKRCLLKNISFREWKFSYKS